MSDSDQDDHKELVELYGAFFLLFQNILRRTHLNLLYFAVYDLSGGIAAQFSEVLLGKRIEGVWHTSIVVAGLGRWS